MVGAGVIVGMLLVWLSRKRLEFTWRISWLMGAVVAVCAASLPGGIKLMTFIAGGIFTLVHGIVAFLGHC